MVRAGLLVSMVGLVSGCGASTASPTEPGRSLSQPSAISISSDRAVLLVGESAQLRALVTYSDGSVINASTAATWKSSDDTVYQILPNGTVSALAAGRATITATWALLSETIVLTAEPSVRGRVTDFRTSAGVPSVVVQLTGQSEDRRATTDASGAYVMPMPSIGVFTLVVDSRDAGRVRLTGSDYRGDLVIDSGPCISRYGTLADARTLKPIAGATVRLAGKTATSGPDGWYRIDLGCPSTGTLGFNTTILYVEHPNYMPRSMVVGRGVQRVHRLDLDLEPG